jgi:hypothetical protein
VIPLWLLLAAGPVIIRAEGTGGCPSAEDVSARLAGLLGADAEGEAPEVLQLAVAPAGLRLRLWRADGTLVAERTIARTERCADTAEAAAVLTAAWEAACVPGWCGCRRRRPARRSRRAAPFTSWGPFRRSGWGVVDLRWAAPFAAGSGRGGLHWG